jgi:acyl-homoserine lactone acylase PvdQ
LGGAYPALAPAIEALRRWDLRVDVDSVPMSLAYFYGMQYRDSGANPLGLRGMALIDYFGSQSPPAERLKVFAAAVSRLVDDFGRWDTPWGEINRFQRLSGDIDLAFDDDAPSLPVGMASGDWGALASYRAVRRDTRRLYGISGNSFVAVVEFGEKLRAKSLLAGGQSGDPASPHFDDQAGHYVRGEFKEVAFYPKDVEARAQRRYHPGE